MRQEEYLIIKGKIIRGVLALTSRTILLQVIAFVSTLILTILLTPEIFGIFFIVSALISFLGYFSDIGLAAALIQKKEDPSQVELATVFTIQQILVFSIVTVGFLLTPFIKSAYHLDQNGQFLFTALMLSFVFSSLKTIPSILLERKLDFNSLIIPQLLESFSFYATAIILAYMGMGVSSFAWAALIRGLIGLIAIYVISPWRISFSLSIVAARQLLSFGFPFQMNSILALVKDDLMTLFLGRILPFAQVGYIGWAKKWAEVSLRLIMDSVVRVTFPAYSRLKEDKQILKKAIEKSLFFLAVFIFPTSLMLMVIMRPFLYVVPNYIKWEPALLSFYLFSISSLFAAFSSPIVNALNAIGKVRKTLLLMIMWTVLTWVLIPLLTKFYSFDGVAIGAFIIAITGILPIIILKKYITFSVLKFIIKPLIISLISCLAMILILSQISNLYGIIIASITGVIIYSGTSWALLKNEFTPFMKKNLTT